MLGFALLEISSRVGAKPEVLNVNKKAIKIVTIML